MRSACHSIFNIQCLPLSNHHRNIKTWGKGRVAIRSPQNVLLPQFDFIKSIICLPNNFSHECYFINVRPWGWACLASCPPQLHSFAFTSGFSVSDMVALTNLLFTISSLALLVLSVPLKLRDVVDPPITSPTASTVWHVGEMQLVTWQVYPTCITEFSE